MANMSILAIDFWIELVVLNNGRCESLGGVVFQVVLITGASSGLGEALAHIFFAANCKVILTARREEEMKRVLKDCIKKYKVSFRFFGELRVGGAEHCECKEIYES